MNYKTIIPIFAGVLFCLVTITPNAYASLLIDDFTDGASLITRGTNCIDSNELASVLGGTRNMFVCRDSGAGTSTAETDTAAQQFIFTLNEAAGSSGLNYDNAGALLNMYDLTQGGTNNVLLLNFIKADKQTKVTVEVADSNGDIGTFVFDFGPTANPQTKYIPFMMIDDPLTMAVPDFTKIEHVGVFFEGEEQNAQDTELILGSISVDVIKIGDFVWNDLNGDGIQDAGEPGIAGVTVNLLDNTGTILLDTTATDVNGFYEFGTSPGSYVLEFVPPAGVNFSPQDQGGDDSVDSDADTTTGKTAAISVSSGEINLTVDAGMVESANAICGNGILEPLEECDSGGVNTASCDLDCTFPVCGDGILNLPAGEQQCAADGANNENVIGGKIIPIDNTSLLVANIESTNWMIPVVLSIAAIGLFVASRKI